MSSLPYHRMDPPPRIQLDNVGAQDMYRDNSAQSWRPSQADTPGSQMSGGSRSRDAPAPPPPAHHLHMPGVNNENFYEGMLPGNEPGPDSKDSDHTRNTIYDSFLPNKAGKGPHSDEKGAMGEGAAHPRHHPDRADLPPASYPHDPDLSEASGDESEDFDWDTDDEDADYERSNTAKVARAKRGRKVWLSMMQLARPIRIFIFGVLGTAILMVPFIVVITAYPNSSARAQVTVWSIWLSIIWAAACGTFMVLDWVPPAILKMGVAFYGKAPQSFKLYIEVLIATLLWSKLVLCIAWAWISLGGVLAISYPADGRPDYFQWIFFVIKALFGSGVILLAEKFTLQMIAINFHKVSLKDRLEANQAALKALDRLSASKHLQSQPGSRRSTMLFGKGFNLNRTHASAPHTPGGTQKEAEAGGYFPQGAKHAGSTLRNRADKEEAESKTPLNDRDQRKSNFASQLTDALQTATMKNSKLYRADRMLSARRLAKRLFNAVGHHRSSLVAEDFEPFFASPEEAREAFKHFDFDGNGDITRQEFRDGVQRIFRERKALATSLKDASSAIRKLDGVLLGVALIIMIFIWLLIFNGGNTVANIAPLSTIVVGFSFIFGNSAKVLFESMVFIFATHPYDVGDLVCVDETFMFVVEFGLISTTFKTVMNETIVAPNALLSSSKMIFNCRRSGNQWEVTMVQVGYDSTLVEMIDTLRARMRAYVKAHDREWGGGLEINLNELQTEQNSIELIVAMEHKGNWQNWGERWARRTLLMRQVKTEMESLGMTYTLPRQPVSYTLKPGQAPHIPRGPSFPGRQSPTSSSSAGPSFVPVGGVGKTQSTRDQQMAALAAATKKK